MIDTPKLIGEVGLKTDALQRDVKKAKEQIQMLSDEAQKLGDVFKKLGVKTNFGDVANELRTTGRTLAQVTNDVEKNYTRLYNTVSNGQKKVVETIKLRQKMGFISPEQANDFLKAYDWNNMEKIQQNKKKIKSINSLLKTQENEFALAKGTNAETLTKQAMVETRMELENLININKQYIEEMKKTDKVREEIRSKLEKTETVHKKKNEKSNVNDEKQLANAKLKITKDRTNQEIMYTKMFLSIEQKERQKAVLEEKQLNAQRLKDTIERRKKEIMYAKMFTQLEQEEQKKSQKQAKLHSKELERILDTKYSGSARDRFKSLSNYAFDAGILYGGMQGVSAVTENVKAIEKQSVELGRVMTNASKYDLKELRDNAFEVGKSTSQQVGDVQKIQNLWARTSDTIANNTEAMKKLTEVTAIGMNVGGFTDAGEAVQLLNASLGQLNLQWTEAQNVMDSWIKTADTSAVGSAKDLADATMKVGSQAKLLGLSFHDVNALTAVLANNMAKSGEDIGTAMKTVFSYFQDEGTIKILEKYGVQIKKNATEYNNFNYIMQQLHSTYKKLEADRNQTGIHEISNALGRIRRVDYVGTLMANWDEYEGMLNASVDSVGYSVKQNEKIMSTYEAQVGQLQVAFQELSWSIGESGLLEDMKSLVQFAISGVDWFNSLSTGSKSFILRLIELSSVMALLNKTSDLIAGKKLVALIIDMTTNIKKQVVALFAEKVAQTAVNQSMVAGSVATKSATASLITYSTVLNGALLLLPVVVSYIYAMAEEKKKAREETEQMIQAEKDLDALLKKRYIDDTGMGEYEEKIIKLQETYAKYQEAQRKAKAMEDKGLGIVYGKDSASSEKYKEFQNAQAEVQKYAKELQMLGSSAEEAEEDIYNLNVIVDKNKDVNTVTAEKAIETIEGMQKQNLKIKDHIARYKELQVEVMKTGRKTTEYNNIVEILGDFFTDIKPKIDDKTGAVIFDTETMEKSEVMYGALTETQRENLEMYAHLDEASKTIAINRKQTEIATTETVIKAIEARIYGQQAEYDGMVAMNSLLGIKMGLLDKENEKLGLAKKALAELEKIKPYSSQDFDTHTPEDTDKEYKAKLDEFYDYQKKLIPLENQIEMVQSKSNATKYDKVQLLNEEISLLKQEQDLLATTNADQRKERDRIKAELIKNNFKFDGDLLTNYQHLQDFTGENAKAIEKLVKEYLELVQDKIPELSNKWWSLQKSIVDAENEKLEVIKNAEDKIRDIIKESIDYEKTQLDKSVKLREEATNKKIKEIEREYAKAEYEENKKESEKKLADIQAQINALLLDDSKEAKAKLKELEEEKLEIVNELNDAQKDKEKDDRIDALQSELDKYKEQIENQKTFLDETYTNEKLNVMARQALMDGYYMDINGKIVSVKNAYIEFEDKFGSGMTFLGEKIKNDFLKNLTDAINAIKTLNGLIDTSKFAPAPLNSNITNKVASNVKVPIVSTQSLGSTIGLNIEKVVNIEGNVDKSMISDIEKAVTDALNKIVDATRKRGMSTPI